MQCCSVVRLSKSSDVADCILSMCFYLKTQHWTCLFHENDLSLLSDGTAGFFLQNCRVVEFLLFCSMMPLIFFFLVVVFLLLRYFSILF